MDKALRTVTGAQRFARRISRRHVRAGSGIAAGLITFLTVVSIGAQQPTWANGLCLAVAAILLSVASPPAAEAPPPLRLPRTASGHRLYAGVAIAALGCLVAASGAYEGYQSFDSLFYGGLVLYAAGLVLVAAGLYLASDWRLRFPWQRALARLRLHRIEAATLAVILLLGVALRLYQIGYYPPPNGFYLVDEPQIGAAASDFLNGRSHPWVYPELVYGSVLAFKIFGVSMLVSRYPVILAGIVLLCAFYPFARLFFSRPVALAGTALLAVSRYEIAYMRLLLPACTMMVFEFAILLLGALAIRGRGTYANYAVMGLLTGLGIYSHTSFRLVPLLLLLWWAGWLITERRRLVSLVRAHCLGWLLFLAVAAITAWPYLGILRRTGQQAFTERLTSIMPILFNTGSVDAADPGAVIRAHAQQLAGYFVGPAENNLAVNPPDTSLLDPITATLFLLGLGYALLHLRRPLYLLLISWFTLTLTAGGLVTLTVDGHRFIGALPTVFLFACVPLELLWRAVRDRPRHVAGAAAGLVLGCLAIAAVINVDVTFNRLSHSPAARNLFDGQDKEALRYFGSHQTDSYNYQMGYFAFPGPGSDYGWMVPNLRGRRSDDLYDFLPVHDPPVGSEIHVLINEPYPPLQLARAIAGIYPAARTEFWRDDDGQGELYSATSVAIDAVTAQEGLDGPCPLRVVCGSRTVHEVSGAAAHWTGSMYIAVRGRYGFRAFTTPHGMPVPAVMRLEGRLLHGAIDLDPGWYDVDIEVAHSTSTSPPTIVPAGADETNDVPVYDLRRGSAYGMLLQFPSATPATPVQIAPRRVPFPFVQAVTGVGGQWPAADTAGQRYRAILTGSIAAGHAGTYRLLLRGYQGQAAVFLDGRLVGGSVGVPETLAPVILRLTGRPQVLQIEFQTSAPANTAAGAGLFTSNADGAAAGFLPWNWLTPPAVWQPLPAWMPLSAAP